jgi:flagellar hook assembly protein FlgD
VTNISFDIPGSAGASVATTIKIYDVSGRLVRELVKRAYSPGRYTVTWDGRNDSGVNASSGVYFFHLMAGDFSDTKKMILLR